jgi:type I restriction enzyme M protein
LEFDRQIEKMDKHNRLFSVVQAFSELDLDPKTIDGMKMGYIFEELIRKFSENADAGDHYTGRDIIKTMVSILLSEGCEDIMQPGRVIKILDQACGTGGMLSTSYNFIKRFNPEADIRLFGHEVVPESYAMCLAEMLIKGQNISNVRLQDTMMKDAFPDEKMRFVIENPPFGQAWGGKDAGEGVEDAVRKEYSKGFEGRWGAGLPGSGDMQMLFLQSAIDKLDRKNGRAAIIEDGSPLFVGGTASGESQIRRWFLENDYIEAIIALPTDLFYNTGIATYIWILSMNKRPERKGKIQLIDAKTFCHKLRKPLGNKKNEISPEERKQITDLYVNFEENEYCKIYPNTEFIYREYAVMQPLQRSYAINDERIEQLLITGSLNALYDAAKIAEIEEKEEPTDKELKKAEELKANEQRYNQILDALRAAKSDKVYLSLKDFEPVLETALAGVMTRKDKLFDKIAEGLSMMDKSAEIHRDKKGNIIYDTDTKDVEIVGRDEDIDTYMQREVLPHIPDAKAFFEENLAAKKPIVKIGAEIPFTRYFYKYQKPEDSAVLRAQFEALEESVSNRIAKIFD